MSLPDWGHSYHALYVPLTSDWQCALMLARDVEEPSSWWQLTYDQREQKRKAREKQIDQDRRDFLELFRVSLRKRDALFDPDFPSYVDFIRNTLRASLWDIPVNGDGVVRVLCAAVRDGRIVPVIHRAWRGSRRVARSYAPQSWPKRAPDPKPVVYSVRNGEFVPLNPDGTFVDYAPYVPLKNKVIAGASSASSGFDWPGAAETAADAELGGDVDPDGDDTSAYGVLESDFVSSTAYDSAPLGDAQPFDYQPEMPGGDAEELAAGDGRPGNNQAQNKQFRAVVKALGLNQDQARQLHDDIQDDDEMDYHGLMDRAQDLFGGSD
ncbi:hypothetical protein [Burkholderia sp. Ax-1719]|uniref:hypothetical protein n=1 Tax=Burkholderia sp. Ax-1719 TaxID=2608334 RepID=UPI001F03722F|nr:hypothetical protein [Burkholderia sp. Ax-1719]